MAIDPSTAFVSYSREDLEFANRLTTDLRAKGAKVWMDKIDILAGQRWEAEIEVAVGACSRVLVILSPASVASTNVMAEVGLAIDDGKQVVPVFFQECKVPFRLRPLQYADFRSDYNAGLQDLLETLEPAAAQPNAAGTGKQAASRQTSPPTATLPAWLPKLAMAVAAMAVAIALFYSIPKPGHRPSPVNQPVETKPAQTSPAGNSGSSSPREPASSTDTNDRIAELLKQAQAGNSTSMVDLGYAYHQGDGVPRDYQLALDWYRKGADAGNAQGMYNVGVSYQRGYGVPIDYAAAASWYTKAADAGTANAMNNLGVMYRDGLGVPRNLNEAAGWFRKAADGGNFLGMANLGAMYERGQGGLPQDDKQAAAWYQKAAVGGDSGAMTSLGWFYLMGKGVGKDETQAVSWSQKAAAIGNAQAMNNLGWMYQNGYGVTQNRQQAIDWYRKAAKLGNEQAKTNLRSLGEAP
jgi:TPR repeat protein